MTGSLYDYGADGEERLAAPTDEQLARVAALALLQTVRERELTEAEEAVKAAKAALASVAEKELPEAMAAVNLTDFTTGDGLRVRCKEEHYPSIAAANVAAAHAWLREHGHGDLIKHELGLAFGAGEDPVVARVKETLNAADLLSYLVREKEAVHAQTLKAFVREQLAAGTNLPEAITVHTVTRAKVERKKT